MTTGAPVENMARLGRRLFNSEFFNEVYVPMKVRHGLAAPVRAPGGGALALFRAPGERAFNEHDEAALAQVAQYLRYALSAPVTPVEAWGARMRKPLLLLDPAAACSMRPRGGAWLYLLSGDGAPGTRMLNDDTVTPLLAGIVTDLHNLRAPLPQRIVVNDWGRFTLRAHWLEPHRGGESLIGVSIALQPPLPVSLLRTLRGLPLSPRHKELCLYLVRGLSYPDAAKAMRLRPSTVVDYAKETYTRLGVRGREAC